MAVGVDEAYVFKIFAVESLHGEVAAYIEVAFVVLAEADEIVAGEPALAILLSVVFELVAVVAVETVACGNPYHTVAVLEYLVHKAVGELVVGGI
jgi:hypothetical protein